MVVNNKTLPPKPGLSATHRFADLAIKKPPICMGGLVASIGASLEEFAADVRAVLEVKL